jgi:hypothetical protein
LAWRGAWRGAWREKHGQLKLGDAAAMLIKSFVLCPLAAHDF